MDDDIKPADLGDQDKPADEKSEPKAAKRGRPRRDDASSLENFDAKDAEIARLRAELATAKGHTGPLNGGKFTCSIKDGPTVTIEAEPGERPEDAFLRTCGIHSTPHRIEVSEAHPDSPIGVHLPNGRVKSLSGPELYQPIGAPAMKA